MDDGGLNNMEADSLSNLTLTESELLNLQQAGVLVTNPSTHFSQTDFDTLASIQDDLETFNINSHNQEEIAEMAAIGKEMEGFMKDQMNMSDEQLPAYPIEMNNTTSVPSCQPSTLSELADAKSIDSSVNPLREISLDTSTKLTSSIPSTGVAASLNSNSTGNGNQAKSIQIIKAGTGFSKLKLAKPGSSGVQQIRIQSASAKPITMSSNTPGAQVLQQPKNVLMNKVQIRPGQVLNIVNSDGSIQTVNIAAAHSNNLDNSQPFMVQQPQQISQPIAPANTGTIQLQGGQTVHLVSATGQKIGNNVLRMINPIGNQIVAGGQVQLAQGGKISLAGNQIIQVGASGAGPLTTSAQGIKVIGNGGQTFRLLNDGKLVAEQLTSTTLGTPITQLQKIAPQVSSSTVPAIKTFKPEQGQLFRTADKKLIAFTGDKNVILSAPATNDAPEKGPQIIQLSSDDLKNLQKGQNQIQFVKVVNSAGQSQTIPIQMSNSMPATSPVKSSTGVINEGLTHLDNAIRELQQIKRDQLVSDTNSSLVRVKKPCNCTKSQCLKLYCDCFAVGEFCSDCNCTNCHNNLEFEEERQKSIRQCLDRNPNAFRPKIGKNPSQKDRRHNKGCNCKRSGCLKNYCECFEAKIICTDICKCVGCKNIDETTGSKMTSFSFVEQMPDDSLNVSEKHFKPTTSLRSKLLQAAPVLNLEDNVNMKRQPFGFLTQEVVEATCQCLLAQAEQGEKEELAEEVIERQVIQEFGRCLGQIIDFASKTKTS